MITIPTQYLTEYSPADAADILGQPDPAAGVYRFVSECGTVDVTYLGQIEQIEVLDIDPLSEEFHLGRQNGILSANDNTECAAAQYILVGNG